MVKASFFAKLGKNKFVQNGLPLVVGPDLSLAARPMLCSEQSRALLTNAEVTHTCDTPPPPFIPYMASLPVRAGGSC